MDSRIKQYLTTAACRAACLPATGAAFRRLKFWGSTATFDKAGKLLLLAIVLATTARVEAATAPHDPPSLDARIARADRMQAIAEARRSRLERLGAHECARVRSGDKNGGNNNVQGKECVRSIARGHK